MHIVIIPGTNRSGSVTVKLSAVVAGYYQALGHTVDVLALELGPEFLDSLAYKQPAPGITAMVARFMAADGVVFLVPEYNGSYPGVLKLFIDMLPYPQGFEHRPCTFIGVAAGQFQGLRAVEHLQGVAAYRNAHLYPNRVFIGEAFKLFNADGAIADTKLAERLNKQAAGFAQFVTALKNP